jgi:hypothetical protein
MQHLILAFYLFLNIRSNNAKYVKQKYERTGLVPCKIVDQLEARVLVQFRIRIYYSIAR